VGEINTLLHGYLPGSSSTSMAHDAVWEEMKDCGHC
jgi:hypothetical protein